MRLFGIIGKKAKYPSLSWWENFLSGHIQIGNVTIYGANAMMWAINIKTKKWGYICFSLPSLSRIKNKRGWYFYLSPNATPWASTFYRGSKKEEKIRAQIRKFNLGHNFDTNNTILNIINRKFDSFAINEFDI